MSSNPFFHILAVVTPMVASVLGLAEPGKDGDAASRFVDDVRIVGEDIISRIDFLHGGVLVGVRTVFALPFYQYGVG